MRCGSHANTRRGIGRRTWRRPDVGRVRLRHRNHATLGGASIMIAGACMSRISTTVLAWRSSTVTATILSRRAPDCDLLVRRRIARKCA